MSHLQTCEIQCHGCRKAFKGLCALSGHYRWSPSCKEAKVREEEQEGHQEEDEEKEEDREEKVDAPARDAKGEKEMEEEQTTPVTSFDVPTRRSIQLRLEQNLIRASDGDLQNKRHASNSETNNNEAATLQLRPSKRIRHCCHRRVDNGNENAKEEATESATAYEPIKQPQALHANKAVWHSSAMANVSQVMQTDSLPLQFKPRNPKRSGTESYRQPTPQALTLQHQTCWY